MNLQIGDLIIDKWVWSVSFNYICIITAIGENDITLLNTPVNGLSTIDISTVNYFIHIKRYLYQPIKRKMTK